MAGGYQGFEIKRNLEENPVDINALNNLGVAPIADDISLFKNNRRNVSFIEVANSNINSTSDFISFADKNIDYTNDVVFTNGTRVLLNNNSVYYVKNSNGETEFQLSTKSDLSDTVQLSNSFSGTYFRSDEVTVNNISNYKKRRRAVAVTTSGELAVFEAANFEPNIDQSILKIEDNLTRYKTTRESSIIKDRNFTSDVDFNQEGHTLILDPDGSNDNSLTVNTGPGLFIYNFVSNTKIRAFSDSQNVWEPNLANTYLQTSSKKITVGSLSIESNVITIEEKSGTSPALVINAASAANITNTVFTHKVKALINGEEYYICLSNSAAVP
jgi:hypothetical protein